MYVCLGVGDKVWADAHIKYVYRFLNMKWSMFSMNEMIMSKIGSPGFYELT